MVTWHLSKNDKWRIYRHPVRRYVSRMSFIVLQYAHYVATNGFIALEWSWPSACQAAIPGDRPFELCARARLRVCIQSPHEIYVCPACLPHTNISMNFDVRSPVCPEWPAHRTPLTAAASRARLSSLSTLHLAICVMLSLTRNLHQIAAYTLHLS